MSTREARCSQSAISFNFVKKHREISNQRHRCDPRNTGKQASASTIKVTMKGVGDNTNPNLTARPARTDNTNALAIKLNRL